jgi:hypothetical protein
MGFDWEPPTPMIRMGAPGSGENFKKIEIEIPRKFCKTMKIKLTGIVQHEALLV